MFIHLESACKACRFAQQVAVLVLRVYREAGDHVVFLQRASLAAVGISHEGIPAVGVVNQHPVHVLVLDQLGHGAVVVVAHIEIFRSDLLDDGLAGHLVVFGLPLIRVGKVGKFLGLELLDRGYLLRRVEYEFHLGRVKAFHAVEFAPDHALHCVVAAGRALYGQSVVCDRLGVVPFFVRRPAELRLAVGVARDRELHLVADGVDGYESVGVRLPADRVGSRQIGSAGALQGILRGQQSELAVELTHETGGGEELRAPLVGYGGHLFHIILEVVALHLQAAVESQFDAVGGAHAVAAEPCQRAQTHLAVEVVYADGWLLQYVGRSLARSRPSLCGFTRRQIVCIVLRSGSHPYLGHLVPLACYAVVIYAAYHVAFDQARLRAPLGVGILLQYLRHRLCVDHKFYRVAPLVHQIHVVGLLAVDGSGVGLIHAHHLHSVGVVLCESHQSLLCGARVQVVELVVIHMDRLHVEHGPFARKSVSLVVLSHVEASRLAGVRSTAAESYDACLILILNLCDRRVVRIRSRPRLAILGCHEAILYRVAGAALFCQYRAAAHIAQARHTAAVGPRALGATLYIELQPRSTRRLPHKLHSQHIADSVKLRILVREIFAVFIFAGNACRAQVQVDLIISSEQTYGIDIFIAKCNPFVLVHIYSTPVMLACKCAYAIKLGVSSQGFVARKRIFNESRLRFVDLSL